MAENKIKTVKPERKFKKNTKKAKKVYTAIPHCKCDIPTILKCLTERFIGSKIIDDSTKAGNYTENLVKNKGYKLVLEFPLKDGELGKALYYNETNPTKLRMKLVSVKELNEDNSIKSIEVSRYYLVDKKDLENLKALAEEKCECNSSDKTSEEEIETPPSAMPV